MRMNSSASCAGKLGMLAAAQVLYPPDASSNRIARPSTTPCRPGLRSGAYGLPAALDSRTNAGTAGPWRCSAVVSARMVSLGVNRAAK